MTWAHSELANCSRLLAVDWLWVKPASFLLLVRYSTGTSLSICGCSALAADIHHHHIRFWYLRCCGCPGLRGRQHLSMNSCLILYLLLQQIQYCKLKSKCRECQDVVECHLISVYSRRGRMWSQSATKVRMSTPSLVISRLTCQSYVTISIHRANTLHSSASSSQRSWPQFSCFVTYL